MTKSKKIHYSVLRRVTLCNKDIIGGKVEIIHTDSIDLVDCEDCLTRHAKREALIKKHGVVE